MQPHAKQACVVCDDAATNHVCPICIEKKIKQSASGKIQGHGNRFKAVRNRAGHYTETNCMMCGKRIVLCPHYTADKMLNIMRPEHYIEMDEDFMTLSDRELVDEEYYLLS